MLKNLTNHKAKHIVYYNFVYIFYGTYFMNTVFSSEIRWSNIYLFDIKKLCLNEMKFDTIFWISWEFMCLINHHVSVWRCICSKSCIRIVLQANSRIRRHSLFMSAIYRVLFARAPFQEQMNLICWSYLAKDYRFYDFLLARFICFYAHYKFCTYVTVINGISHPEKSFI